MKTMLVNLVLLTSIFTPIWVNNAADIRISFAHVSKNSQPPTFSIWINNIPQSQNNQTSINIKSIPIPHCTLQIVIHSEQTDTIIQKVYLKPATSYHYVLVNTSDSTNQTHYHLQYQSEETQKHIKNKNQTKDKATEQSDFQEISYQKKYMFTDVKVNQLKIKQNDKKVFGKIFSAFVDSLKHDSCHQTIDTTNLTTLITDLKNKDFQSEKLRFAKQQISRYCFTFTQIKQIIECFDFDNIKIDLAKFAYNYVSDQENHQLLQSVFEFKRSQEQWKNYIVLAEKKETNQ